MRRRFLADEIHDNTALLTGQNAAHLARVLRARVGQEYEIASGGSVRLGRITLIEDDHVEFELGHEVQAILAARIELVVAIFKFDRFEWAIEKATELGVARILPVIARRTDSHLAHAAAKRVERWRRIVHEASQQSRRAAPPQVDEPVKLADSLGTQTGLRILLAETEEERTLNSVLEEPGTNGISLAVGPEGGWAEEEFRLFLDNGWLPVTLGQTILRAETAVVASVAIVTELINH